MEQFNYTHLLAQVKQRVQLAQQRAVYAANGEMLRMYWDIGHLLSEAQKQIGWGNGALQRLSSDMRNDYLEIKGFSVRNCQCMIQFYNEYNQELTLPKDASAITQSPIAQLERTIRNRRLRSCQSTISPYLFCFCRGDITSFLFSVLKT